MSAKRITHTVEGYSVVFLFGTKFFALNNTEHVAGRAFFRRHRDAVAFKRALAEHGMKTRVVKATATLTAAL
jgi:hypothetical protein